MWLAGVFQRRRPGRGLWLSRRVGCNEMATKLGLAGSSSCSRSLHQRQLAAPDARITADRAGDDWRLPAHVRPVPNTGFYWESARPGDGIDAISLDLTRRQIEPQPGALRRAARRRKRTTGGCRPSAGSRPTRGHSGCGCSPAGRRGRRPGWRGSAPTAPSGPITRACATSRSGIRASRRSCGRRGTGCLVRAKPAHQRAAGHGVRPQRIDVCRVRLRDDRPGRSGGAHARRVHRLAPADRRDLVAMMNGENGTTLPTIAPGSSSTRARISPYSQRFGDRVAFLARDAVAGGDGHPQRHHRAVQ